MKALIAKRILTSLLCLTATLAFTTNVQAAPSNIQFVATYLQPGTTTPSYDYLPEIFNHISSAHMGPQYFGKVRDTLKDKQAIIDLADEFFEFHDDNNMGALLPGYKEKVKSLGEKYFNGHESKIRAFYVADEPTGYGITRTSLEEVIKALKEEFPHIPTYIVYYKYCFDNTPSLDDICGLNGERGVPANLDWVGFDWYLNGSPADDNQNFQTQIVETTRRLQSVTKKPIILVPDGTDEFVIQYSQANRDKIMKKRLQMFLNFAKTSKQIIGIDNYAWANHRETLDDNNLYIRGTREYPQTRELLFQYSASILNVRAPLATSKTPAKSPQKK